jgi:hypothetical protein
LVIDPAFFGIESESFFSLRLMIAAATDCNCVATITTTIGDGRMSRRVFRQRDSNLGQYFTPFAASAGFFNRGNSEAGSTCFDHIDRGVSDRGTQGITGPFKRSHRALLLTNPLAQESVAQARFHSANPSWNPPERNC